MAVGGVALTAFPICLNCGARLLCQYAAVNIRFVIIFFTYSRRWEVLVQCVLLLMLGCYSPYVKNVLEMVFLSSQTRVKFNRRRRCAAAAEDTAFRVFLSASS